METKNCIICGEQITTARNVPICEKAFCRMERRRQHGKHYYQANKDKISSMALTRRVEDNPERFKQVRPCNQCAKPLTTLDLRVKFCDDQCRCDYDHARLTAYKKKNIERIKAYNRVRAKELNVKRRIAAGLDPDWTVEIKKRNAEKRAIRKAEEARLKEERRELRRNMRLDRERRETERKEAAKAERIKHREKMKELREQHLAEIRREGAEIRAFMAKQREERKRINEERRAEKALIRMKKLQDKVEKPKREIVEKPVRQIVEKPVRMVVIETPQPKPERPPKEKKARSRAKPKSRFSEFGRSEKSTIWWKPGTRDDL